MELFQGNKLIDHRHKSLIQNCQSKTVRTIHFDISGKLLTTSIKYYAQLQMQIFCYTK